MKKIVCLLLSVLLMLGISGCGTDTGIRWDGCDTMSFEQYLQKGFEGMFRNLGAKATVTVTRQEGWPDVKDLTLPPLSQGAVAVTYTATFTTQNTSMDFHFFMEQTDTLSVKAAQSNHQDVLTSMDAAQATEALTELSQYIK